MNTNPHAGHSHHSREDVGANRQEDVHGQSPVDAHAQGHSREAPAGSIYTCCRRRRSAAICRYRRTAEVASSRAGASERAVEVVAEIERQLQVVDG